MAPAPDPTDAVVSLAWQTVDGTTIITEQGSGVLVAPDEVLTADHLVRDASGRIASGIVVSGTLAGQPFHAAAASVQAMPAADWAQVASAAGDFALIHLATPLAGLPLMALGSGFAGGVVMVTGYPLATSGARDSAGETLAPLAGSAGILQGTPLGAPGDPHGASGGPAWQTVDGVPTVVGLTSSASGATGYFVGLTAADVAQIDAWMAADHASAPAQAAPVASAGAPSPASQAVAALSAEAPGLPALASHPAIDAALSRVASLLAGDAAALGAGAGFGDVAADVLAGLGDNGSHRNLAAALLEGIVWGYGGGDVPGSVGAVAGDDPGILSYAAAERSVRIGARAGQGLLGSGF